MFRFLRAAKNKKSIKQLIYKQHTERDFSFYKPEVQKSCKRRHRKELFNGSRWS